MFWRGPCAIARFNVGILMAQEEINEVLVGGASLDPISFAKIVNLSPFRMLPRNTLTSIGA